MDDVEAPALRRASLASATAAQFAELVTDHLPYLSAVAARDVGAGDAEDVVQEALIRAWRRLETFDPARGSIRSWLVAIVLDQARRHRTRSKPVPHSDGFEVDEAHRAPDARIDLHRAVDGLPRRQREVVTLYYLADLSVDEVAGALGITSGTVKSTLFDARRALHTALEQPQ